MSLRNTWVNSAKSTVSIHLESCIAIVGFHPTPYIIGRFRDEEDELITFWGQKVKGQGHDETNGQKSTTVGVILPP